ncbi:MAG: zinc ribbon domain-containing protein, partial [Gammaproteobacteria bacterium]|nr:zinc ribbon domain-containing protein [Gammaproteobacteria bacterium]
MTQPFRFCPQCAMPLELSFQGDRDRLACPAPRCGFVHWDNPTPVVAAIVEHEGQIILARNAAWPSAFYALITG